MPEPLDHCPVCDRSAAPGRHPCRFAVCCVCWRGVPCDGSGRVNPKAHAALLPDQPSKRGRAAALLSDAEIDGILNAQP